ncbi:MAG: cysteine-rich KTR domain-containing protein [Lachnospiraceae bacterium]|nr:cysteine-rich KTR domain-containing protein [Lachnospiraceae bacterium]
MNENQKQEHGVLCPHCSAKTRVRLLEDTERKCFPLFCPKCKHEILINAKHFIVSQVNLTVENEQARR